jgi:hypothetical protein
MNALSFRRDATTAIRSALASISAGRVIALTILAPREKILPDFFRADRGCNSTSPRTSALNVSAIKSLTRACARSRAARRLEFVLLLPHDRQIRLKFASSP